MATRIDVQKARYGRRGWDWKVYDEAGPVIRRGTADTKWAAQRDAEESATRWTSGDTEARTAERNARLLGFVDDEPELVGAR